MKKVITNEEKLAFYESFYDKKFFENYKKIRKMPWFVGNISLSFFSSIAIILGFLVNPWLFLLFVPAIAVPSFCVAYIEKKQKQAIESLNENISYSQYKEMLSSGEWKEISQVYCSKILNEMQNLKHKENNVEKSSKTDSKENEEIIEEFKDIIF